MVAEKRRKWICSHCRASYLSRVCPALCLDCGSESFANVPHIEVDLDECAGDLVDISLQLVPIGDALERIADDGASVCDCDADCGIDCRECLATARARLSELADQISRVIPLSTRASSVISLSAIADELRTILDDCGCGGIE